jgi:hypothetical protein
MKRSITKIKAACAVLTIFSVMASPANSFGDDVGRADSFKVIGYYCGKGVTAQLARERKVLKVFYE